MSRYSFEAVTSSGKPVSVTIGWDSGLSGYFLTIERKAKMKGRAPSFLFNNLSLDDSHPKTLDGFIQVLKSHDIPLDEGLLSKLKADRLTAT